MLCRAGALQRFLLLFIIEFGVEYSLQLQGVDGFHYCSACCCVGFSVIVGGLPLHMLSSRSELSIFYGYYFYARGRELLRCVCANFAFILQ